MEKNGRKKKATKKKVLLSIVDPWDVKVASVDPLGLASRRGVSIENLDIAPASLVAASSPLLHRRHPGSTPPSSATASCGSPLPVRTPWPWYKPGAVSPVRRSASTSPSCDSPAAAARLTPTATDVPIKLSQAVKDREPAQLRSEKPTKKNTVKIIHENPAIENKPTPVPKQNGATKEKASDKPVILDCPSENTGARVELTFVDEADKENGAGNVPELDCTDGGGNNRVSDKSLVSLVEDLVRSRYNQPPVIYRKLQKKPLVQRNVDLTDTLGIYYCYLKANFPARLPDRPALIRSTFASMEIYVFYKLGKDETGILKNDISINGSINNDEEEITDQEEPYNRKVRKLSLSMPTKLDDMEDLRIGNGKSVSSKFARRESDSSVTFSNSGSTLNGSTLGSDTEDEENEEESSKIPLQSSGRPGFRPSVLPSTMSGKLANEQMDYPNAQSTNSTITSVNSISSLLKEKLQWSIPQALRSSKKRQNADYRLRGFVGFLFLCVIFLVGFAHVYYTHHVLQRAYFDKFRFNKNERLMHVYSSSGVEIISARLGVGIPADTGVFSCLPQHQRADKVCLEWLHHSRLYLGHTKRDSMNCYHVTWQSLDPAVNPQDCFDWSPKRGHWYGAGQIQNMAYPLEQGRLEPSPFITGDIRKHPFGNVLKRYFLNSKGATITVDPETPLYVSINVTKNKELCLMAKHDAFAYINHLTDFPQLNYSICSTDNMKNLHSSMAEKFLWDGLKPDELQGIHSLLTEPVWQISPTNEADIYNYTEDVIALGFLRQGHVLLSEEWQPSSGDFTLDETRFKSMKETIDVIHRRGFRIVFTVQPFISTESENFKDAVNNRLLISERGSDPRIPALTRYRSVNSAGVLDITNNKTLPWLQSKLEPLMDKYHVDSFYLDLGTAQDMPHYYKCEQPLTNPDHYKTLFVNSILGSVPVIGVSSAIARPRAPVFVSLPPFPSSWKAIKTVIPTVLSYGIIGYPFLMPGAVGGDVALPMSDNNPDNDFEVNLPDKELYLRWLQLSTFLPVIRFTHLPSKYSDDHVLEVAKTLTTLRQKTVTPLLKKYANVTLDTGLPIIRPLWMLDPADPACHLVVDEFSVGEELIVAPILHSGSRQREVYLPAGVWKDGIDNSLRKGSRWIHNYRVADDKIAYFVKMPDDMRF